LNRGIGKYINSSPINYAIVTIIVMIIFIIILSYDKYPITTWGVIFTPILTILFVIIWDGNNLKKKERSFYLNLGLDNMYKSHIFENKLGFNFPLLKRYTKSNI
jgi:hypothetical protein